MEKRSIDELKKLVQYYSERSVNSYDAFKRAQKLMKSHRDAWDEWRTKYEEADYELAEADGRLHIIQSGPVRRKKEVEAPVLTLEQIKMLAERVGIVVELDFEEDVQEEGDGDT